ncbi:MAG: hypothetical protein K2O62_03775, partial [Clostridia bacterium]|nr:hypothetical protein [Clostridia bacterium]
VEKVGNLTVRLKDGFAGVWRTTANSDVSFDFNGFGKVKYTVGGVAESADYDSEGNFSIDSTAYKATINEKGVLEINGKEYYLSDGFTGTWYFGYEKESIELTLEGIGRNGYGYATISYVGNKVTSLNAQYDVMTDSYGTSIRLFVDDRSYGELTFNPEDGKASGMFYSMHNSAYYLQADFCLYDNFKGTWVSNSAQIDTITFDGMSASGEAEVTITAANGAISRGTYSLDDLTGGTVTVGGETYALRLDELTGLAVISLSGDTQLARRDNWYGVTLYEGDTKYEFDGKGYLNGTVKVSGGTELTYTVNGSSVTVGGETLTPTASGFTLGSKTLVFKSGFAGEWQISGSDYYLTVEEVGGSFKAKVTCSDPKITGTFDFVFNPSFDASSVTLSYTEEIGGERIVTRLSLLGSNEISIKQGDLTYNCIRTSLVDNWKGTYNGIKAVLIDEVKHTYDYLNDGTSWTFDGLGNCFYGSGTATFTDANGEKTSYKYKLNSLGV